MLDMVPQLHFAYAVGQGIKYNQLQIFLVLVGPYSYNRDCSIYFMN